MFKHFFLYRRFSTLHLILIAALQLQVSLAWSANPSAQDESLTAQQRTTIHYIEDVNQSFTIGQIISSYESNKSSWHQYRANAPGFGFTNSAYWLAIKTKNSGMSQTERFVEIDNPGLDSIDFFVVINGTIKQHIRTGDKFAFNNRPIKHSNFVFKLENESVHYIRIATSMDMSFPVTVWDKDGFSSHNYMISIITGCFYGILLVMIIYNSLLGFVIHDESYLYYVLFIASLGTITLLLNGVGFEYIWPGQVNWNNSGILVTLGLANIFALLLIKTFLLIKDNFPAYNQYINYLVYIAFTITILTILSGQANMVVIYTNTLFFIVVASTLCFISFKLALNKNLPARIFLAAVLISATGSTIKILYVFGFLANSAPTRWSMEISTVCLVVIVSFAFALRYTQIKHENMLLAQANEDSLKENMLLKNSLNTSLSVDNFIFNPYDSNGYSPLRIISQQSAALESSKYLVNEVELRRLICEVMNLSLTVWEKTLKKTKLDLAEESGLWRIYIDKSTPVTRTLDKYLKLDMIPKRPKLSQIIKTALFVIENCPDDTEDSRKLYSAVERLRRSVQ